MCWDDFFQNAFVGTPQLKVSEEKPTCFAPGATRHLCIYTAYGDYLALNPNRDIHFEPGDEVWFLPFLQDVDNVGEKLGSWMKALVKQSLGTGKYQRIAVEGLPADISAAGFRPAVITEMFDAGIPGEWGAVGSGQDCVTICTWYRYMRAQRLLASLCATVLAGWKSTP